jgi:hypothetical protein
MEELSAKEQGPISTKLLEVMPKNSDDHFIELVRKRLRRNPYDGTNKSKFIPTKKHVSYKELLKVAKLPIRPKLKRGFMEESTATKHGTIPTKPSEVTSMHFDERVLEPPSKLPCKIPSKSYLKVEVSTTKKHASYTELLKGAKLPLRPKANRKPTLKQYVVFGGTYESFKDTRDDEVETLRKIHSQVFQYCLLRYLTMISEPYYHIYLRLKRCFQFKVVSKI